MRKLHENLNNAGYICDPGFAAAVQAAVMTKPVAGAFLFGPIGTGKTYLPEVLAEIIGADYYFHQCFPGTREDDLLVKMLPNEEAISGIALYDGVLMKAVKATNGCARDKKVVLVLDEWDKTRPSADAFLLDFLQNGRISFAGTNYHADLSRLIVFLTLNVEREISEPLLRRLPKIDFQPLPPSLVHKALMMTHKGHPFLYSSVILYERCLTAGLPKPATIQELRQLLDAITTLGLKADWDNLVYEFVTKTEENHELLRRVEKEKARWKQIYRQRLDAEAYSVSRTMLLDFSASDLDAVLPSLKEIHGFSSQFETTAKNPDLTESSGVIQLNYNSYNEIVRMMDEPPERPDRLGEIADVAAGYISLKKNIQLKDVHEIEGLWGEAGEILIQEPLATWQDVKMLQDWAHIKIVKFSKNEILAKSDGLDLRWTPEHGAEIIVDLGKRHVFNHCFGDSWGKVGQAKWIGHEGLIYLKYQERQAAAC